MFPPAEEKKRKKYGKPAIRIHGYLIHSQCLVIKYKISTNNLKSTQYEKCAPNALQFTY